MQSFVYYLILKNFNLLAGETFSLEFLFYRQSKNMQLKSVLGSLSLQLIAESFFLEQQFMKKINSP